MNSLGAVRQLNKVVENSFIEAPASYKWIVLLFVLAFSTLSFLPFGEFKVINFSFYSVGAFVFCRYSPVARRSFPAWLMFIAIG